MRFTPITKNPKLECCKQEFIFLILSPSDQIDPFNRKPLKVCDLKLDTALKTRIDEWLVRHNKNKNKDEKPSTCCADDCCDTQM
jgi:hypothetical protein